MQVTNVEGMGSLISNMPEGTVSDDMTQEQESQQQVEQDPIRELLETLSDVDGSPDEIQLEQWKAQYGRFYVSSILGDDIYIWRTLKRKDYKTLASSGAMEDETVFKESVIRKCLLFPSPDAVFMQKLDAGTVPTLFEQVMYQSGFIPKELAISMVRRI